MEKIVMTPPDAEGDSVVWDRIDFGSGVILAPDSCTDQVRQRLLSFTDGNFSLAQAASEQGAEDLTEGLSESISARVVANGSTVCRFYTDRFPDSTNGSYLSWLCSNLMLEKALDDNPKYMSVKDPELDRVNIRVAPVEYMGVALRSLPNGLRSTLTVMSRAPGLPVASPLAGEKDPESGDRIFGLPESVFLECVGACLADSFWPKYPASAGQVFLDPHERNVIVDEVGGHISVIDVNGIALPLSRLIGPNSLADLVVSEPVLAQEY